MSDWIETRQWPDDLEEGEMPTAVEYKIDVPDFKALEAHVKWDGCINFYYEGCEMALHVCNLSAFIKALQELHKESRWIFKDNAPRK